MGFDYRLERGLAVMRPCCPSPINWLAIQQVERSRLTSSPGDFFQDLLARKPVNPVRNQIAQALAARFDPTGVSSRLALRPHPPSLGINISLA